MLIFAKGTVPAHVCKDGFVKAEHLLDHPGTHLKVIACGNLSRLEKFRCKDEVWLANAACNGHLDGLVSSLTRNLCQLPCIQVETQVGLGGILGPGTAAADSAGAEVYCELPARDARVSHRSVLVIDACTVDDKLILAGDDLVNELLDWLRVITDSRDGRNDLMDLVSVEDDLCLDIKAAEATDEQLVVQSLGKRILLSHAEVLFLGTGIGVEHALVTPGVPVHAHGNLRTLLLDMLGNDKFLR